MNSSHLRLLHFVVQTGGFAAAAREAGVSQPAVTQAMQALERESGLRLFEKVGRHKQPTHAARVLVQQGADLLQCVETLVGAQAKASGGEALAHTLRVGLTPAACLLYGATIERIWRLHAPQGLLQIDFLFGGGVDLGGTEGGL